MAHRPGHEWRDQATQDGLCAPERGRLLTACPSSVPRDLVGVTWGGVPYKSLPRFYMP